MNRTRNWCVGLVSVLILLFIFLYFFNWDLARPYIGRKISEATGRNVAINGHLHVRLSMHPHIIANDIVVSNASWAREPNLLEIGKLDFRIDLQPLFSGHFKFPEMNVFEPHLALETNNDGGQNWALDKQSEPGTGSQKEKKIPEIGRLKIVSGSLIYRDPRIDTDMVFQLNTMSDNNTEYKMEIKGKGRFKGMQSSVEGQSGELLKVTNADTPYPIKLQAVLGFTKLEVDGVLIDPLHLKGENINFTLEGSDLAQLYPILGVPIPPTAPYKLTGALNHTEKTWTFKQFKGAVGKSDLKGDFSVDVGQKPQFIKADLISNNLDMADLGGFIGAKRGDKPADKPPPAEKLLPAEPFSLEKLRAANADVRFRAAHFIAQRSPLEKMDVHLILENGILTLQPLNFSIAGGNLETEIKMDGRKQQIATHANIAAKGLHLDKLMPTEGLSAVSKGILGGRARLDMKNNSVAQMLGSANGEAALIMDGGSVSEFMLRLSNLDIANSIFRLIGGDKQTPIRCLVSNMNAVNGDFQIQTMVLDTPKVNLHGTGNVNLNTEALNLTLAAESKDFSLASLKGPIAITGTLKDPAVNPVSNEVITRGGLAAALGATTGVGALLPLLDFGDKKNTNCSELIDQAKENVGVKNSDIKSSPAPKKKKR